MPTGAQSVDVDKEVKEAVEARFPAHKEIQYASVAASLALSVMMLVSGIALFRMKVWGRLLAICYGFSSVLLKIFSSIITVMFTLPAMQQVAEATAKKGQAEAAVAPIIQLGGYVVLFGIVFAAFYPIIVLVIMLLPSTSAVFRREESPNCVDSAQGPSR